MAATRPRGVGPVVAQPATRCHAISAVVALSPPSLHEQHRIVARPCTRRRALRTHRRPFLFLTPVPVVARCGPVVASCRSVVARCRPVVGQCGPSSRAAYPSSRGADPSLRPFPRPPHTHPRTPYKYARVSLFPRTLSEHPDLHLPRRLLAGFSKGCFIFFIARHPPRLEFREHSAVKSALVILNYLEIKHCFFSA